MASFQIPEHYYEAIKYLIDLNEEQSYKLIEILREIPPSLKLKQTVEKISNNLENVTLSQGNQIISLFQSLHYLLETEEDEISLEQLTKEIAEAVDQQKVVPYLEEEDKHNFSQRLAKFIDASSVLGIVAKATKVLWEHERVFLQSRILTDIKTVFRNLQEQPAGAFIVHNLVINYKQNGEEKEFFVTLDASDLAILGQQIIRAESKAEALKRILDKAGIAYLSVD